MDNAITMDLFISVRDTLIAQGRWEGFDKHCIAMAEPLEVMGSRGLDVDPIVQKAFMERLEEEWDRKNVELQASIPEVLKRKKFWKRAPKNMTGVQEVVDVVSDARTH
jgi:hypothetical protein